MDPNPSGDSKGSSLDQSWLSTSFAKEAQLNVSDEQSP